MSRRTDGPWVRGQSLYGHNKIYGVDRVDGSRQLICEVYGYSVEERDANLRIILDALGISDPSGCAAVSNKREG